ncbi:hypothetical protein HMPREF9439_01690 [Parasutterella excrementihominis YIT 11859]|uniref:Uncharacterized protein n=1 Tax=Parasutterella excrementihominis YIT 11859 TaxID=762966 RepID=F3QL73_9BURK|nr:hypothetical protein HMPREF9439_01690 [Parasutterella excrementihominis YIT 11859]
MDTNHLIVFPRSVVVIKSHRNDFSSVKPESFLLGRDRFFLKDSTSQPSSFS